MKLRVRHLGTGVVHAASESKKYSGFVRTLCGFGYVEHYQNSYERLSNDEEVTCSKCLQKQSKE